MVLRNKFRQWVVRSSGKIEGTKPMHWTDFESIKGRGRKTPVPLTAQHARESYMSKLSIGKRAIKSADVELTIRCSRSIA